MKELIKNFFNRFVFFTKRDKVKINIFNYQIGKKSRHEMKLRKEKFRKGEITVATVVLILYLATAISCLLEVKQ